MIDAALEGKLYEVEYQDHPIFGMAVPMSCPNVPAEMLNRGMVGLIRLPMMKEQSLSLGVH
jgi:hypothetical protein